MRNKRIFLGFLLVIALMVFAGCSTTDDKVNKAAPNTPDTVTDTNDVNNGTDTIKNDVNKAVDDAGNAVENLVTTNGAVDQKGNNL
ncbi:MAG: hypothetical protein ACK5MV_00745 [Aminipila sp.]